MQLVEETGAQAVLFNHLYDPISLVRDNEVKTAMQKMQVCTSSLLYMSCKAGDSAMYALAFYWKQRMNSL